MYRCYIDGELIDGKEGVLPVINPGTETEIGQVSLIDEMQAHDALLAAERGFDYWSSLTLEEREGWIKKLQTAIEDQKDEILDLLMQETGKVVKGANEDYQMLQDCLDFCIQEAKRLHDEVINDIKGGHHNVITREPIGVVIAYLAWNFPLLNLGYKLGPVLASGCSCIIKPSELTPLATLKVAEILESINFPKGVVNIVLGDVNKISHVFNSSTIPQLITLIGSTATGKKVMADSITSIKRFSLELGGNAPALVLKDYDPVKAATTLTEFKFQNSGQVCASPNRIYVHESQLDSFLCKAKEIASNISLGWGAEPSATMGPLISPNARERMFELIDDAIEKGATLVYGGKVPDDKTCGFYMEPTIIANVTPEMRCYKEEIFGPIMSILTYDDSTDLIKAGNDTEYGLTAYVFSDNVNDIFNISRGIKSGTVCVNEPLYSVDLPHGGIKESGVGKDCSRFSLEEYYYIKRISIAVSN